MDKTTLINTLGLERHIEGGYFRRSYESEFSLNTANGKRHLLTSIYYLLSDDEPIGHFHQNRSDILHFFHAGSAIDYYILSPAGQLQITTLGPDPGLGHQFQLLVKSGSWKASQLRDGEYALISEAVSPGFDFADMRLADAEFMQAEFPQHWNRIRHLVKS